MDAQEEEWDARKWTSIAILGLSAPLYELLCWPAIHDRGYPGIDPVWGAVACLWIVPIMISKLFDGGHARKQSLCIYTVATAFVFSGTQFNFVPHHETFDAMLFKSCFWAPVNLLIAFGLEKLCGRLFKALSFWKESPSGRWITPSRIGIIAITLGLLGASVWFPFAARAWSYDAERAQARIDAERDWESGKAILYFNGDEPEKFGASSDGYSVSTGLKTERIRPGVRQAIYFGEYRSVISNKLTKFGPVEKAKELPTKEEIQQ